MGDHGSTEENVTGNSLEIDKEEVSKIQTLTQETVKEQIRGFIAPVTRRPEELTQLVQRMVITQHLDHNPTADFGTTFGTASHHSDTST